MSALEPVDGPLAKATLSRVTRRLIPFLLICYAIAFIDRTNISVASLTMNADIGLSDTAFGLGAGVFFIGYVIFEVPSNQILARIGARIWISRIMVTWGIVSVLMMFVSNEWTFYGARFLLGVCEAGFYPGVIYFLTRWFPSAARGRAFSLFQIGGPIALVIGSPLAGSLLGLNGVLGLAGWQWIFIVTGVPAVVAGVIAFAYLTDAPKQAKWLDADQREWLTKTMVAEHGAEAHSHALGKAMKDPLVWTVSGINFFIILSLYGISLWLPRIVQGLTLSSNFVTSLIAAIPYVAAVVAVVLVARNSDKHANRYMHVLVPSLVGAAGFVVAGLISHQPVISLLAISIASAGIYSAIPPMWGMTTGVLSGPVAAAAIGFISALGNVGGFVGPYLSGLINTATGNTVTSLLALAASLALAAVLVLVARQIIERRLRSERLDSATTQGPATVEA